MTKRTVHQEIRIDKGYRPTKGTSKPPTTNLPNVVTSGIQTPQAQNGSSNVSTSQSSNSSGK